ncbi:MAG TPA: Trm112 family protein [Chloroflexota bacterium]|nr:Trm112 family protein [Chloroflexota bacterium]
MSIDPKLLEILACPACDTRPPVRQEDDRLICDQCKRRYPIRDGIPVMLVDEAEQGN